MTIAELAARVARDAALSRADARRLVEALFHPKRGVIATALRSGHQVSIEGFGTFKLQKSRTVHRRHSTTARPIVPCDVLFQPAFAVREGSRVARSGKDRTTNETTPAAGDNGHTETSSNIGDELWLGGEAPADVQFSTYHPRELADGEWHPVLVYAHIPAAVAAVQNDSNARLGARRTEYGRRTGKATTVIKRGAEITVVPELPGCRFNPPRASVLWVKDWHRVEFDVQADTEQPGYVEDQAVNGRVAFYVGPILVGETHIWAHIAKKADTRESESAIGSVTVQPYRKIFVSYSHQDARIVDALEMAYQALGDLYLRDVRSLRSGELWNPALLKLIEEADIFQLCWSSAAKASKDVRREWVHALQQERPGPFVRPTYWETPMPAPPARLKKLQFAFLQIC